MKWISNKSMPDKDGAYLITDGKNISIQIYVDNGNGSDWNDCDRLPEKLIRYNSQVDSGIIGYNHKSTMGTYINHEDITHWMPLPELPEDTI